MRRSFFLPFFLLILPLSLPAPRAAFPASAADPATGALDPAVRSSRDAAPPDSLLSVIVLLRDRLDLPALNRRLTREGASFADRHARVMGALKRKAGEAAEGLLEALETERRAGSVGRVHPYWIAPAVAVRAAPAVVRALGERGDVAGIVPDRRIALPRPVDVSPGPPGPDPRGFEPNLAVVGADSLWRLGYSGKGILVGSLDSGVDVEHPALAGSWRGNQGFPASECWFDPYDHSARPVDDDTNGNITHGTGVMSLIVGSSGSDTVGVAPGALWIAANAFESDGSGTQISTTAVLLECFEWAADPDGNPATVADVPRVVNNSWGTNLTNGGGVCDDVLDDAIDAVEAMGSALFFSAGNTGSGSRTIASPASRIASPVNAFAVGAVTNALRITSFSSRGPSPCDGVTVKPEVVAPGDRVRMARGTAAGGGYHSLSGTSFSTPHVAGGAALLLEANPELSGEAVKTALLNSATDLGDAGEDNDYGAGVIDLPAALRKIGVPTRPSVSIVRIGYDSPDRAPDPGETVEIVLTLRNDGAVAPSLHGVLEASSPGASVEQSDASFGTLEAGEEADNAVNPFRVAFDGGLPDGESVRFSLNLSWSGGGAATIPFTAVVGDEAGGGRATHAAGNVEFTVTNFGQYGYYNGVRNVGQGFRFPKGGTNWLFHGAFLAGTGPSRVSDGTEGGASDWRVAPGGSMTLGGPGEIADEEGYAAFQDDGAADPLGLEVLQRSFAWSDTPNGDYVMLVYFLINTSDVTPIENLHTGLYFDWDLDSVWFDQNFVDWDPDRALGYMWSDTFDQYVGVALLSHSPTAYRAIDNPAFVYDGFTDAEKYQFLAGGFTQTRGGTPNDWSQMLSVGPFTLAPRDTMSVVFAVLGGQGLADILDNAEAAKGRYEEIRDLLPLTIVPPEPPALTGDLRLDQNYPNPFPTIEESETTIGYHVTQVSEADSATVLPIVIRVFDTRGRQVRLLLDRELPPGDYSLQWDGRDDRGAQVPSGIYLYRLEVGARDVTRKLVFIH